MKKLIKESIKYHKQHKAWIDDWLRNESCFSNYVQPSEVQYRELSDGLAEHIEKLEKLL